MDVTDFHIQKDIFMVAFRTAKLNCETVIIAPLVSLIRMKKLIYASHQYDGCSYTRSLLNTAICPNQYSKITS